MIFLCLSLCLFHAPLSLGLAQVFSARDTYVYMFTLCSSSDTAYAILFAYCLLFIWLETYP